MTVKSSANSVILILFAISDNLSAENSKLSADSWNRGNHLLGCMSSVSAHPKMTNTILEILQWKLEYIKSKNIRCIHHLLCGWWPHPLKYFAAAMILINPKSKKLKVILGVCLCTYRYFLVLLHILRNFKVLWGNSRNFEVLLGTLRYSEVCVGTLRNF